MTRQLRFRRIAAGAAAGVALKLSQLATSLIVLPLTLHTLGFAGFGVWSAATSIAWLSYLLDLGLGSALVTLLPRAQGDSARHDVTAALTAGAALCILALAGLATARGTLSAPFLVAGFAIALNIPLSIGNEIWLGLQKSYVSALCQIASNLLTTALLIAACAQGWGVTAMTGIVYAAMLAANSVSLAAALLTHPALRPHGFATLAVMRRVAMQGSQMFAITVASLCAFGFDNVLALAWAGPEAAGRIAIALRVCTTATGLIGLVTQPFWPGFADAIAAGDRVWLRRTVFVGTLVTGALAVAGSVLMYFVASPLLRWWLHADIDLAPGLLLIMGAWITLAVVTHIPGLLLNAALQLRPQIAVLGTAAAIGFALKFFGVKLYSIAGILAAPPLVELVLVVPAYLYLAAAWLDKPDVADNKS
jgi:O-antigen/teichoic acid export membrane protein